MSAKQRQGMKLNFAFVGLVDIFFAATAIIIILIITLNQQTQLPTYIPQTDLILVCHETNKTVELRQDKSIVAISDLRSLLQKLSSSPTLRIQIWFHAKSTRCYKKLKKQFKAFNKEIERSQTLPLPFIIYSGHVVSTP